MPTRHSKHPKVDHVKGLFLEHKYRSCVSECANLLAEEKRHNDVTGANEVSLNASSMLFYAALSHETMARNMPRKPSIIKTLDLAEKLYLAAIDALPAPLEPPSHLPRRSSIRLEDTSPPSTLSSPSCSPKSRRSNRSGTSTPATSFPVRSDNFVFDSHHDMKSLSQYHSHSRQMQSSNLPFFLFPVPPSTKNPQPSGIASKTSQNPNTPRMNSIHAKESCSRKQSAHELEMWSSWQNESQHVEAFNNALTSFINMLNSHIASVRDLKLLVLDRRSGEANFCFPIPPSFNSKAAASTSKHKTRNVISSGASEGNVHPAWDRSLRRKSRFDPRKSQDICREALSEL